MVPDLHLFALDLIDNLAEDAGIDPEESETVAAIFGVAVRGEDSEVKFAYRSATSDQSDNVALLLDMLKAELQQS